MVHLQDGLHLKPAIYLFRWRPLATGVVHFLNGLHLGISSDGGHLRSGLHPCSSSSNPIPLLNPRNHRFTELPEFLDRREQLFHHLLANEGSSALSHVVKVAGVLPILKMIHQSSAHRILVDVGQQGNQIGILIDVLCLGVLLEEAPMSLKSLVNCLGVGTEPDANSFFHSLNVFTFDMDQKVKMGWHEAVTDGIEQAGQRAAVFIEEVKIVILGLEGDLGIVRAIVEVVVVIGVKIHDYSPQRV